MYYSPSLLDFSRLKTRTIHCDATSRHSFYTNKTSTPRHLYQGCSGDIFHLFLFSKQEKERIKRSRRNPGAEIISPPSFYKTKEQKFSNNCFPIEIDVSSYSRESVARIFHTLPHYSS